MVDRIAKAKAYGTIGVVAQAASLMSLPQEWQQVVADADLSFAMNTTYIYEEALLTAEYMDKLVTMLDRLFGETGFPKRQQFL